ncbi:MAG: hypothetical protein ICV64_01355 [Thermoleophilia bacterium]|nr:hypothetical protein [Thermoleophilia bacterium]
MEPRSVDDAERPDAGVPAGAYPAPLREEGAVLLPATVAGLMAALAGGVAWGAIVRFSEYEVGIVAWAIGLLVGLAVGFAARGTRGATLQAVAVACALLGVLVGKYLSFAWTIQDVAEEQGVEVGVLSGDMFSLFRENLDTVFGGFDLIWVALAAITAWRMLRPEPAPAVAAGE